MRVLLISNQELKTQISFSTAKHFYFYIQYKLYVTCALPSVKYHCNKSELLHK